MDNHHHHGPHKSSSSSPPPSTSGASSSSLFIRVLHWIAMVFLLLSADVFLGPFMQPSSTSSSFFGIGGGGSSSNDDGEVAAREERQQEKSCSYAIPFKIPQDLVLVPHPDKNFSSLTKKATSSSPSSNHRTTTTSYNNLKYYSSHRCVEAPETTEYPAWHSRTCHFFNLYYEVSTGTFHYHTLRRQENIVQKLQEALRTAAGSIEPFQKEPVQPFEVKIHGRNEPLPSPDKVVTAQCSTARSPNSPAVFVLYQQLQKRQQEGKDHKLPHPFLYHDLLTIFTMMDYFGYSNVDQYDEYEYYYGNDNRDANGCTTHYQHIPLHLQRRQDNGASTPPSVKAGQQQQQQDGDLVNHGLDPLLVSGLLGVKPDAGSSGASSRETAIPTAARFFDSIIQQRHKQQRGSSVSQSPDFILLDRVIAGAGKLSAHGCSGFCALHRASQMHRFRQWLFQNVFGDDERGMEMSQRTESIIPGRVTVIVPSPSQSETQSMCTFKDHIVPALRQELGSEQVTVLEEQQEGASSSSSSWSSLMQSRIMAVAKSSILITNQGISTATASQMTASPLFLSQGSTAVIFFNNTLGLYPKEHVLYSTMGHLRLQFAGNDQYCSRGPEFATFVRDLLRAQQASRTLN